MKIIKGDLILKKYTTFEESIKVEGNIKGYFDLKVIGNIDALNIDARNINARNIDALDISALDIVALDISALDISAWNIDAWNIICEKRIKKYEAAKTICRVFIQNKSDLEKKEQMGSEDKPKKDYNAQYENQEMKGGKK